MRKKTSLSVKLWRERILETGEDAFTKVTRVMLLFNKLNNNKIL
jgi:hypothetical protein